MNALELEEDDDIQPLTTTGSRSASVTSRRQLGSSHPYSIRGVRRTTGLLILFALLSIGAVYNHMKTEENDAITVRKWKMLSPKAATDAKLDTSLKSDNHPPDVNSDYVTMTASPTVTPVTASPSSAPVTSTPSSAPFTASPSSTQVIATINATKQQVSVSSNTSIGHIVLPNILLIGAQKAGTTAINSLLKKNGVCHAQTFPGEPDYYNKEVHFFDDYNRYAQGIEFYAKRFKKCVSGDKQFILDATPNYLIQARRVYKTYSDEKAQISAIKNLKLICILREPISRELSWYNHKVNAYTHGIKNDWVLDVAHGNSTIKTFDEYSDGLAKGIRHNHQGAFGLYVDHLKEWVKWFDRKKLLILSYDEFHQDPSMVIQRIEKFLGTNLTGSFPHTNSNENPLKVKEVPLHAKEVLGPLFKEKNEELYKFIKDHPGPSMEQSPFPRFKDV